jgi:hypothetical protein
MVRPRRLGRRKLVWSGYNDPKFSYQHNGPLLVSFQAAAGQNIATPNFFGTVISDPKMRRKLLKAY